MSPDAPLERSVLGKRASIIDVFENFFGDDISRLSADFVMKLPSGRGDELVHHIDEFLASEASAEFSQDAVCIDGLANPILVADDPMEPKTTRKAKQVGLMHTEVVFPIPPLALEHAISGVKHTAGLLVWSRANHRLLREHVFSLMMRPNFFAVAGEATANELLQFLTDLLLEPRFEPVARRFTVDPGDREAVEAAVASVLTDAMSSGTVRGAITFLDEDGGLLYDALGGGELLGALPGGSQASPTSSLLEKLDLPAIDNVVNEH